MDDRQRDSFEIVDFGPIAEAKIDLRPLTVFVGPHDTGKSYLAILIYALHRHFSGGSGNGRLLFFQKYKMPWEEGSHKLSQEALNTLFRFTKQTFVGEREEMPKGDVVLTRPIVDLIYSTFDGLNDNIDQRVAQCFGVERANTLIRKGSSNGAKVVFRRDFPDHGISFEHRLKIGADRTEFSSIPPEGLSVRLDPKNNYALVRYALVVLSPYLDVGHVEMKEIHFKYWEEVIKCLADLTLPYVFGPLLFPAFYLPANRTEVMHAHNVVIHSPFIQGSTMFSGVLSDFLNQLTKLSGREREDQQEWSQGIEETILGGSLHIEGEPPVTYRPKGWQKSQPLLNSPSMVSELAPLVLYLRYVAQSNHVLIIEEPESHLSLALQSELIRQLATLVCSGIRVIMMTHSQWILKELANLVSSSFSNSSKGDDNKVTLDGNQVGVWSFQQQSHLKNSVVVKEIPF